MTAIIELLAPLWGYIAAAVAALGVFLAAQAKAKRDGRKQERAKQTEKDHAEADRIRDRVADRERVHPDDLKFRD
jgi:Flp pilus assembly protein TadB